MIEKFREKLGPEVKEKETLANHVTFRIGGPARYFYEAKTKADLVKALKTAEEFGVNYFLLGGGSNLLVSDKGFDGLVIKPLIKDFKIDGERVYAEAGVSVQYLLAATLEAGLVGFAWVAGLPGTIGGAVYGNAGAYGEDISGVIESVEIYQAGLVRTYSRAEMKFSYRHSIVKETKAVILSLVIKLKKGDVKKEREQIKIYTQKRCRTQPLDLPSAGCTFKNVDLTEIQIDPEKVRKALDLSESEYQAATKYNKLPISFIFDRLGLKGKKIGGAQVSEKHGAFIVNAGGATAEHVVMLISDLKMRVRNELGIQLQEEIQYVGF